MAHQALGVLAGAYKIIDSIPENLHFWKSLKMI